jgi:hypothetical protein
MPYLSEHNHSREIQQSRQQIQSSSMRHARNYLSYAQIRRMPERLVEVRHHTFCSFTTISFDGPELRCQKVIEILKHKIDQ